MISPSQRSSGTDLPLPPHQPMLSPYRKKPSRIVRFRRKCFRTLLSVSIFLNGLLSPAMAGLMAHVLAYTHDQVPTYGKELKRPSSYLIIVTAALGVIDACVLVLMTLYHDDVPIKMNWSGKKHQEHKIPVHRIAALVSLAAVLRGAAAAVYSNYDYFKSDQTLDQNLNDDDTIYTPETWLCRGVYNNTMTEGEHPDYTWLCREAEGARYLTILITVISGITFLLVLWRWRRRNMERYQPVNSVDGGSAHHLSVAEHGLGGTHMRLSSNSSSPAQPQEVVGREIHEMPADPIHEMEHHPVIRDSDELSIQDEYPEYFAHERERERDGRYRRASYEAT